MFLRSAKNVGFEVPKQYVDDGMKYVHECWNENEGIFYYTILPHDNRWSRGMVGVGIFSLSMAGQHETRIARKAGQFILRHPFKRFGETVGGGERWFYSAYTCSQAMSQLGGEYWNRFYPTLVNTLLALQRRNGDWPASPSGDRKFGTAYTTALSVLAITPPLQLLPVYQR